MDRNEHWSKWYKKETGNFSVSRSRGIEVNSGTSGHHMCPILVIFSKLFWIFISAEYFKAYEWLKSTLVQFI